MRTKSSRGAAYAIVSQLPSAKFEIVLTIPLYMEYQGALTRPEVMQDQYTVAEAFQFTRYLSRIAHQQAVYFLWRPWLKDPKDDMVLEAALASRSRYIVTYNLKDFSNKVIEPNLGVLALTPQQFLERIR